ncbi:MAG: hypothetical protein ACQETH_10035 [Candidatus Rifleibacteriota bacterium]
MKTNLIIFSIYFFFVSPPAQAYIDPGTGSFIFQLLISALVGGIFIIKTYWQKIRSWFSGKKPEEETLEENKTDLNEDETAKNKIQDTNNEQH